MANASEIIMAPLTLYLAPVGTAFPAIDAAPAADWAKVGTNGDRNYGSGVTVAHNQTFAKAIPEGANNPAKVSRTEETMIVSVNLWDLSIEQYAMALNNAAVTTTAAGAGTAGYKEMGLSQGFRVQEFALLARGVSPLNEAMAMQYEVKRCYQSGNPSPVYGKNGAAGLALAFEALADLAAADPRKMFGRLLQQHQLPLQA